jgi:hypothetical protein
MSGAFHFSMIVAHASIKIDCASRKLANAVHARSAE